MKRSTIVLSLLCALVLISGCNSQALNAKAATNMQNALTPRLQALQSQVPDTSPKVQDVLTNWTVRSEQGTHDLAVPLLRQYEALHPEDAQGIDIDIRNWESRLAKFSTTQP